MVVDLLRPLGVQSAVPVKIAQHLLLLAVHAQNGQPLTFEALLQQRDVLELPVPVPHLLQCFALQHLALEVPADLQKLSDHMDAHMDRMRPQQFADLLAGKVRPQYPRSHRVPGRVTVQDHKKDGHDTGYGIDFFFLPPPLLRTCSRGNRSSDNSSFRPLRTVCLCMPNFPATSLTPLYPSLIDSMPAYNLLFFSDRLLKKRSEYLSMS